MADDALPRLADLFPKRQRSFLITDIGALFPGDLSAITYYRMLQGHRCKVIGFEPATEEIERLRALNLADHVFLQDVIGDGSERTFHLCNYPMTSSLYEPDPEVLSRFLNLDPLVQVVKRRTVRTRRLDEIPEVAGTDFLKIDVQGAELDVLRGAKRMLQSVAVVHAEVEFVPLYHGQPLFADVDAYLRQAGFVFHCFRDINGRTFRPFLMANSWERPVNQILWADAVYVRDWKRMAALQEDQLWASVWILHEIYGSFDLVHLLLSEIDRRGVGGVLAPRYREAILIARTDVQADSAFP
jgi:FkbM family methyltransferase